MSARTNGGMIFSNARQPFDLVVKITGAADVEATGFTIDTNSKGVLLTATRLAEGKIRLKFKENFAHVDKADVDVVNSDAWTGMQYASNGAAAGGATVDIATYAIDGSGLVDADNKIVVATIRGVLSYNRGG